MREVKDPEIRKAEIMAAAKSLFYQKGYLNTTTQDIIKALGISRGLLYYHFKSKEDILYSIVEKHLEPLLTRFHAIAYDEQLSVKEKVVAFINSTIIDEASTEEENYALQDAIELPENNYMMDKINRQSSYTMTKYFAEIIRQGNNDGTFKVQYPEETSALLMTGYSFVINDTTLHQNDMSKALNYFNAFLQLINQTLSPEEPIFDL